MVGAAVAPTPSGPGCRTARRWRRARRAARRARGRCRRARSRPRRASASAHATSNAALDDKPAPTGTVDVISRSAPTGVAPELGEHARDAGDGAAPRRVASRAGRRSRRRRCRRRRRSSDERATMRPSSRAVARTTHVAVDRHRDDPAFVVVDLTADQVHAPGRAERARRRHASRSACAAASGTTGFDSVPLPDLARRDVARRRPARAAAARRARAGATRRRRAAGAWWNHRRYGNR